MPEGQDILFPVPVVQRKFPVYRIKRQLLTSRQCDRLLLLTENKGRYYKNNDSNYSRRVDVYYLYPQGVESLYKKIATAAAKNNLWGITITAIVDPIHIPALFFETSPNHKF